MKNSRRIKRMSRNRVKVPRLNLTSLMDVFTILVFFLLVNSGSADMEAPRQVTLPESVVESKPRETVVIIVTPEEIVVQGQAVMRTNDVLASGGEGLEPIRIRLAALKDSVIGVSTQVVARSEEVAILADKSIPFNIVKNVMSACTSQGYVRISLAVIQKAAQTAES